MNSPNSSRKRHIIIWHDPKIASKENVKYTDSLKELSDIKGFDNWEEASKYIEAIQFPCHVITSGTNGQELVKEISPNPRVVSIFIFARSTDYHKTWSQEYPKVGAVKSKFENLKLSLQKSIIAWRKESSSSHRDGFPLFSFDTQDIQEFIIFNNRAQAKKDFLTLASSVYLDKENIVDFRE